jgi:uncharacterized protein (DUF362 family)
VQYFFVRLEALESSGRSKVFVIKTDDREIGVRELLKRFVVDHLSGKRVAIKANFNSADPFPASTHLDTLAAIVGALKDSGSSVLLAERSGMGITRDVLYEMGVMSLSRKLGFDVVVLDQLRKWHKESPVGSHWKRGYLFPDVFKQADAVVTTCCLKTHRFGGHFTMSLKNSVGMVAKHDPGDRYNYMYELHGSPYQRLMIAEINAAYLPLFVIMDGIKGFSRGGPEAGTLIEPGLMLASSDRVALDAAGVAVLRVYGTTPEVSTGPVFQQEQLARAAELGLGVKGPDDMDVIPMNDGARDMCARIEGELREPGKGFKEYHIAGVK